MIRQRRPIRAARSLVFLLTGFVGAARAQATLSPEEAVRLALQQNSFMTAADARVTAAQGLQLQAGLKPNPRLFLQAENLRIPVNMPFVYGRDADSFAYVSRVIETGGKRQRRIDLAQENVAAAGISAEFQRLQLSGRVLFAYWNAAGAQRLASVLAESLKVLDQTVQYQQNRVREGALAEADLIRIQLEYQQVAVSHQNARQDALRLVQFLYREIGAPPNLSVSLSADLAALPDLDTSDIRAALDRRPDVRLAEQGIQQTHAAFRLQHANAKPDPEVLFGYKRTMGMDTAIAGLQINLPFQNRNQGAIAAAAADESAARHTLQATKAAARTEIEALLGEYVQKRDLVAQLMPTLRSQANETRQIADAVYREGASDLLRLLDAERVRIQAETLYVRSLLDLHLAAINLQTALGRIP